MPFAAIIALAIRDVSGLLESAAFSHEIRWVYTSELIALVLVFEVCFWFAVYRFISQKTVSSAAVSATLVLVMLWLALSGPRQTLQAKAERAACD